MPHTPGPWRIVAAYGVETNGFSEIENGEGKSIVASCDGCPIAPPERKADLLLIAAAPDLLAALEEATGFCERVSGGPNTSTVAYRAAIAKAKGGAL